MTGEQRFRTFIKRSFAPFVDAPEAEMDAARERVLQRLQQHRFDDQQEHRDVVPAHWRVRWPAVALVAAAVVLAVLLPSTVLRSAPAVLEDGFGSRAIQYGEVVRGGTLRFPDGSRVEVRPRSEVSLEQADDGVRLSLHKGQVAVLIGEARVQQGNANRTLRAGEQVETVPPAPEPRLTFETVSIRPYNVQSALGGRGGGGFAGFLSNGCSGVNPQVDPSRFAISGVSAFGLITFAYGTTFRDNFGGCLDLAPLNLISGGPDWIRTEPWDVQATIPSSLGLTQEQLQTQLRSGDYPQLKKMLLAMLEDRFRLVVRREMKEIPAYVLSIGKNPSRLTPVAGGYPAGMPEGLQSTQWWDGRPAGYISGEPGSVLAKEVPIQSVIPLIAREAGRPVVDRTGLGGPISFWISFRPEINHLTGRPPTDSPRLASLPTLSKALEDVGLKLEETKVSREVWTIEKIERPSDQ